ncbi:hypothetical protein [Sphingomonas jatrophae]|uniref:Uncharacterized protein n=1 Tax=Sphingomonas jatrophae TaxID=1166337 RepID=A0A1I6JSD8_9SPHN|nr:hypothetical protein [Sphingomonas jatrophae]SFR81853.1 hypothetical protein SAMN05192580_0773 [Sphingomonas jatrophae]
MRLDTTTPMMTARSLRKAKPEVQRARLSLRAGRVGVSASVKVTPSGLLSIGALVSGVLLSTAVLVRVSTREAKREPQRDPDVPRLT